MLVLSGMSLQSQKRRNGLHTQFLYIPPRSHASRCASGNFGSGSAKNRVVTAATEKGDCGRAHFADESSRPTQSVQVIAVISMRCTGRTCFTQEDQDHCSSIHPQLTHHLLSSVKPRDRESGGNCRTTHIARPSSLRYPPAHDRLNAQMRPSCSL